MIDQAREYVAELLSPLGIPVHPYPPATVAAPAAVVVPDDPYYTPTTLAAGPATIGLAVRLIVSAAAGIDSQRTLDALIIAAASLLAGTPAALAPVPAVRPDPDTATLTAELPITIHWTE